MKKTILFMDNNLNFLVVHAKLLEQAGYHVLKASTVSEASIILSSKHVHIAILDIRMEAEEAEEDISGLILAQDERYRSMPKIMLTAHPSYKYAREALGPTIDGLSPAVKFIGKAEGPEALLKAVEEVFEEYLHLNWDLTIRWRNHQSFFMLINFIEPEIDDSHLPDRIGELEGLFRKLFYESTQITIGQLLFQEMGQVILKGFAYAEGGAEKQFVLSVGRRQQINQENIHYDRFVPKDIGPGSTVKEKMEETVHYAATIYTLVDGDLEEIKTFKEFYPNKPIDIVQAVVDDFFFNTLAPWHKSGKLLKKIEMDDLFLSEIIPQAKLEARVEMLCQEALAIGLIRLDYSSHQLTLHPSEGSPIVLQNPIGYLYQERIDIDQPVMCGTIHGRLNIDNLLVERTGKTWLVYFTQVGEGPLVRDFVSLETMIKLELLETLNMSIRYEMEQYLLTAVCLDQVIDAEDFPPEIQKTVHTVCRIRYLASTIIGHDRDTYLVGLLYSVVNYLIRYDPDVRYIRRELAPYLHSLLAAALLCEILTPPQEDLPYQALYSLFIDEGSQKVWVEGRQVVLSPQEFDLLHYLYDHKGRLCDRTTIAEEVFGVSYEADVSTSEKKSMEEGRLNSTMSRLRKKIEPNPNHPKYIISVRGQGYRLEVTDNPT